MKNVLIVGLGLIGGSIARDLNLKSPKTKVWAFDQKSSVIKYALKNKIIHAKANESDFKIMDLVILATPVSVIESQLEWISKLVGPKTIVTDVGSTKKAILKTADRVFKNGNFVGSHPMAGSEKSSIKACVPDLFKEKTCLVVAGKNSSKKTVQKVLQFWKKLKAHTLVLGSSEHDKAVAAFSHLPHLIAFSLMHSVGGKFELPFIKKVSGRSFKSYTRIAGSDPKMWTDIFLANKKDLLKQFDLFEKQIHQLRSWVEKDQDDKVHSYIETSRKLWEKT